MATTARRSRAVSIAAAIAVVMTVAVGTSAEAAPARVPMCSASALSAKVTGEGAGMSQPAVYITVTNTSGASCRLNGYPTIVRAATKNGRRAITVANGAVMNAPHAKPKRVVLAPNGHAWFAVGAATAYDPPVVTFTRIRFTTATGRPALGVSVSLQASAPSGKPFPLGVTPFMAGIGTSQ